MLLLFSELGQHLIDNKTFKEWVETVANRRMGAIKTNRAACRGASESTPTNDIRNTLNAGKLALAEQWSVLSSSVIVGDDEEVPHLQHPLLSHIYTYTTD
jgi:hypothetical protein